MQANAVTYAHNTPLNNVFLSNNPNITIEIKQSLKFNKNDVSVEYIGIRCSQDLEKFVDALTHTMKKFDFPQNISLIVNDNKKIFQFVHEDSRVMPQLMSAYTDLCIDENGIVSLPNSDFFVRHYAFEVD